MSDSVPFFILMTLVYALGYFSGFYTNLDWNDTQKESSINETPEVKYYYSFDEKEAKLFNKIQEEKLNLSIELEGCKSNADFLRYLLEEQKNEPIR